MAKELNNYNPVAKIIVIGVGGGGNNSVETMINSHLDSFQIIAANTDKQVLAKFPQECVLHLGDERGIGAGANPEIGKTAAESSREEIKSRLQGGDLVIITAGMGGGTGTVWRPWLQNSQGMQCFSSCSCNYSVWLWRSKANENCKARLTRN
ncbi:hypothetical protein [Metamycoplasma hominis]|uniref:hypothetical protein n=1 Tax=Metamycoplasma hominis TaxID=2098 RepID=UPI001E4973C9|nr:hypothetical protein [Metamycoplasma hominis]